MTTPSPSIHESRADGDLLALGTGWVWPAALAAAVLAFIYLPAHTAGTSATTDLIVSIGGLYVLGASVGLTRIVRGAVLRLAGSRQPIVLLGRGPDPLPDARIRPRWRLAAIIAGGSASIAAASLAALLGGFAPPTTYAHALADLGLVVNLALAAGMLVPAPGFLGWALLLACVDAAGIPADQRVRRTAAFVQGVVVPMIVGAGVVAAFLGNPILTLASFLVAMMVGAEGQLAVGRDAIARFLSGRSVGDLARPVISHADSSEAVNAVTARLSGEHDVTLVESGGALVGALGPRQLARRNRTREGERVSELMVDLVDLPFLPAAKPAADILAVIGRHGFALVRIPGGLGSIEADDVLAQMIARVPGPAGPAPAAGVSAPVDDRQRRDDHGH